MVTKEIAIRAGLTGAVFHHKTLKSSDGMPVRCRTNGACKTWVTRPSEFRLPVKHGLKECFYITPENGLDWELTTPELIAARRAALRHAALLAQRELEKVRKKQVSANV